MLKSFKLPKRSLLFTGVLCALVVPAMAEDRPYFDDNPLPSQSYFGGAGSDETGFVSGDWYFPHHASLYSWDGFTYSNQTDTTTAGYSNQCSAITGSGVNGSENYGVCYVPSDWESGTYDPIPQTMTSGASTNGAYGAVMDGLYITNTTYAYLSMQDGDASAKQFGGASGDDEDWFLLTITGIDESGGSTGTVEFYLADYRFADNSQDYIIDDWTWVDLTSLGEIVGLEFLLSSSDTGDYGMNTPGYFAMDTVPEPMTLSLLGMGGLALLRRRHKA